MLLNVDNAMVKMGEDLPNMGSYEVITMRDIPKDHPSPEVFRYVKEINKKGNLSFPFVGVTGVMRGDYEIGKQITNMRQYEEVSKDWVVLRHVADIGQTHVGMMAPSSHPVAVMVEGNPKPLIGIFVVARYPNETNHMTFLELLSPHESREDHHVAMVCDSLAAGFQRINKPRWFKMHNMHTVMAWSFIDENGYLIPQKKPVHPVKDIFLDCEFDDNTKTLISVGIVIDDKVFYAYDSACIPVIDNDWVMTNVIPILEKVPPNTTVVDLCGTPATFGTFLHTVLGSISPMGTRTNLNIHVDFPTDVAYIAPLFHLGEGKRIGTMPKLQFHVDYVDPYPTTMEGAVQHNAAWDALVLQHHLGYGPNLTA